MANRLLVPGLISGLLHGTAALLLIGFISKPLQPKASKEPTTVAVEYKTKKSLKTKSAKPAPRIGSKAYKYTKRPLGDTLASEHYLERLRAHIDPNWRYFVQQTKLQSVCSTVLNVDADSNGTVLAVFVVSNDCPAKLKQAAIDALYYANLLPPPKQFLVQGKLLLEWTFKLSRKD